MKWVLEFLAGSKEAESVKLTNYVHLEMRLRISGPVILIGFMDKSKGCQQISV